MARIAARMWGGRSVRCRPPRACTSESFLSAVSHERTCWRGWDRAWGHAGRQAERRQGEKTGQAAEGKGKSHLQMRPLGAVAHAEEARGRGGQPVEQAQGNGHVLGEAGEEVEQRQDLPAFRANVALERARDEAVLCRRRAGSGSAPW